MDSRAAGEVEEDAEAMQAVEAAEAEEATVATEDVPEDGPISRGGTGTHHIEKS
jgi:hypothetical protein